MFFFFNSENKKFPVANVIKRGPLTLGKFANLDCVNALQGKRIMRLISFNSFLGIVGISPRAKGIMDSFVKLLTHPSVRTAQSESVLEKLQNGYIVRNGRQEDLFLDCRVVTDFCRLMLALRKSGKIGGAYLDYAGNCEQFMLGLADVGLAALIDEATGYDKIKRRNEYQELFKSILREEHSDWVKEFPDTFFDGIYKVYRLEKAGKNHPSFFGGIINKYIYYPLANSHGAILKKLQAKDPVVECKGRRYKLHQFLTEEVGKPLLRKHINQVEALLLISSDKAMFKHNFKKLFPQPKDQLEFDFNEDI